MPPQDHLLYAAGDRLGKEVWVSEYGLPGHNMQAAIRLAEVIRNDLTVLRVLRCLISPLFSTAPQYNSMLPWVRAIIPHTPNIGTIDC